MVDAKHDLVVLDEVEYRFAECFRHNSGKFEADHTTVAGGTRV
jgi:hypothetical protein